METALISSDQNGSGFFIAIICITAIGALIMGAVGTLSWRRRLFDTTGSGVNLSPNIDIARHEDEKSNNLQNEENFRRYANPLKSSATSLSGAMELSMDVVSVISLGEGSSASPKSQQTVYACDSTEFDANDSSKLKTHRGSQILLYKAQNIDMRNNTVGSIESPHKDFGKRSINTNCKSLSPCIDSELLTVHV